MIEMAHGGVELVETIVAVVVVVGGAVFSVIAFLTNVAEVVGPEARCLHRGMTSSDLIDTSFAVQLVRAGVTILRMPH